MASYENINYAVRPNKRTQRKMIFEALARYIAVFPARSFGYVGFGSMWFADFIYAHRRLGLDRLTSIERTPGYKRALFNRPFKCVRVLEGDSGEILPTLSWRQPAIVWLDYDFKPETESFYDLALMSARLVSGSVLMATFDARPPWKDEDKRKQRESVVRSVFGDAVPVGLDADALNPDDYPRVLVSLLWNHVRSLLVSNGRAEKGLAWWPLFSFYYRDGAPMITIAGAVLNQQDRQLVKAANVPNRLPFMKGEKTFHVAIPPLTPKERAEIDRRLPSRKVTLPFSIPNQQLKSYQDLYQYYPLFAEVDL